MQHELLRNGSHRNIALEYNGKRLFLSYYTKGRGKPPILILHGLGGSHFEWERLVLPYCTAKRRIIILDQPGHGSSGVIEHVSLEDLVEVTRSFLLRLKIRRVILVGQSMGAAMSFMFAVKYPEMVEAVVAQGAPYLIRDPFGILRSAAQYLRLSSRSYPPLAELRKGVLLFFKVPQLLSWILEPDDMRAISPDFVDTVIPYDARHVASEVYFDLLYEFANFDLRDRLSQIKDGIPVLLVDGDKERIPGINTLSSLAHLIPHAEVHVIQNAGHLAPLSHPQDFCRAVDGFLKRVENKN